MAQKIILLISSVLMLSCSNSTSQPPTPPQPQAASTPPPMSKFSDALERRSPVEEVSGNAQPSPYLGVETPPDSSKKYQQLFSKVATYSDSQDGTALLIWHEGKLLLEHYSEPWDQSMRAEPASMHKSVLGLLVAAAIADGDIASADDPIENYIPSWRGEARGTIRIRDLLTMSSGLTPLSREGGIESMSYRFGSDGPAARGIVLDMDLAEPPSTHFHYMNAVSQLLCLVLEKATNTRYVDYLERRLWQPIGAANAYVWNNEADGFPRTYMGLYARPRDWLRVGLLVMNNGQMGDDTLISAQQMAEYSAPSPANPSYGWQIWRATPYINPRFYNDEKSGFSVTTSKPPATNDLLYFDGFGGQRVYISATKQLVIVRFGEPSMTFDDSIIPNGVIEALETGHNPQATTKNSGSNDD